ncbi:hypothetical protein Q4I28_002103 [Leishmania naiffi]|uniref:Uncharacterized protein n=1 Tax=Leishmania naiffi TaxID=5678 RepID=A0AAW3C0R5_9TRYP
MFCSAPPPSPNSRQVHLSVQHAYLATTLLHRALTYLTVTPMQTSVDTIIVSSVTDFTADEASQRTSEENTRRGHGNFSSTHGAAPSMHPHFAGAWATTNCLTHKFPALSLVGPLHLLECGCRYTLSLVKRILGHLKRLVKQHQRHPLPT